MAKLPRPPEAPPPTPEEAAFGNNDIAARTWLDTICEGKESADPPDPTVKAAADWMRLITPKGRKGG
jgi:hypothetical protein